MAVLVPHLQASRQLSRPFFVVYTVLLIARLRSLFRVSKVVCRMTTSPCTMQVCRSTSPRVGRAVPLAEFVLGKLTGNRLQYVGGATADLRTRADAARTETVVASSPTPPADNDGEIFSRLCRPEKFEEVWIALFRYPEVECKFATTSTCVAWSPTCYRAYRFFALDCGKEGKMCGLVQVFELGERLGDGAFAVVHKAIHNASGRELAVKIVDKTRLRRTKGSKV